MKEKKGMNSSVELSGTDERIKGEGEGECVQKKKAKCEENLRLKEITSSGGFSPSFLFLCLLSFHHLSSYQHTQT